MSLKEYSGAFLTSLAKLAARVALWLISIYKRYISPLKPPVCRFSPTCSQYAYEAIARYGFGRGSFMALKRILKCHPFHPGGYDPVP